MFPPKKTDYVAEAISRLTSALRGERPIATATPIPLTLTPAFWVRSDLGITIASGVSAWADQSGNGDSARHAVQASTALRPVFNAYNSLLNGKPSIDFTGVQVLRTGTWSDARAQPLTTVLVAVQTATLGNPYALDSLSDPNQMAVFGNASRTQISMYGTAQVSASVTSSAAQVYLLEFNGASSKIFLSSNTAGATGNAGTNSSTGITIGNYAIGGAYAGWAIAEVISYSRILTAPEKVSLLGYIGDRYAIAVT